MKMAVRSCASLLVLSEREWSGCNLVLDSCHENPTNSLMADSVSKGRTEGRGLHTRRSLSPVKNA